MTWRQRLGELSTELPLDRDLLEWLGMPNRPHFFMTAQCMKIADTMKPHHRLLAGMPDRRLIGYVRFPVPEYAMERVFRVTRQPELTSLNRRNNDPL